MTPPGMVLRGRVVQAGPSPGRGPNGRRLCRWCHQEVPKGRHTWCGDVCTQEFIAMRSPRGAVKRRDHGVCAICGCDTERLKRVLGWANASITRDQWPEGRYRSPHHHWRYLSIGSEILTRLGFNSAQSLWEADHIVPIAEGGTFTLENIRTLCVPCHKRETRELKRRLALSRRPPRLLDPA